LQAEAQAWRFVMAAAVAVVATIAVLEAAAMRWKSGTRRKTKLRNAG
jgi:hypothetical protein